MMLDILNLSGMDYTIIDLSRDLTLPPLQEMAALIILGGPDSANDHSSKILSQLQLIHEVILHGIPYLGICLGMQLLVKAGGGTVLPCHTREIGFRDAQGNLYQVQLTRKGQEDPLFKDIPKTFPVFHLHGETVNLNATMQLLGTGSVCPVQIVKIGSNAYGLQGHVEITDAMLRLWLKEDPDLQALNAETVIKDHQALKNQLRTVGTNLFHNFLHIVTSNPVNP